jgi:hypothetical protein
MDSETNSPAEPVVDAGAPDPAQQRRQVIAAYRSAGLQMDNPLAANLAVINCDLMEVAARTVMPVTDLLQRAREDGASLSDCERWANLHLRFVKQIDRLAAISQKLEASEH